MAGFGTPGTAKLFVSAASLNLPDAFFFFFRDKQVSVGARVAHCFTMMLTPETVDCFYNKRVRFCGRLHHDGPHLENSSG